ncbi:MAG: sulfatase-like hydrolase/transferase [Lentisphaeria bacterium]
MAKKPNILFIFTDMQRADTIHALGNSIIKTPNLDRLVHEGTAFCNCFSPCPVCIPARCCMHYGVYPQKTNLYINGEMPNDNGKSIPAMLEKAGYQTQAIGKCHFTPDKLALRGYQHRLVQEECCSDPETDDYCKWLQDNGYDHDEPHGTRGEMYYIPQISLHDEKSHPSNWIGDNTVQFIKDHSNKEQPWMLFSSFIHPHPPFAPPKPWHKLYRAGDMPLPTAPQDSELLQTWINRKQNRYKYRDYGIDNNLLRNMKAYYYATISFIDFQIGRMIETLEQTNELDNTLILFASDHGEYLGDFNCFGKRSMQDASSRVPMIVRYPKRFAADKKCNRAVSLVDIYPTIAAAAHADLLNQEFDGKDLSEIAAGKDNREAVFSQYSNGATGIYMTVTEKWKYFYSAGDDREFLFDRKEDPQELSNKAQDPSFQKMKQQQKSCLLGYLKSAKRTDAYIETESSLDWKKYPRWDGSYLADPDNGLLLQDHSLNTLNLPGYTS